MNSFVVTGSITTQEGNPIAGARVRIYRIPPLPKDQPDGPTIRVTAPSAETASSPDGSFSLHDTWRGPKPWEYLLEVQSTGHSEYRKRLVPEPSEPIHVVLSALP